MDWHEQNAEFNSFIKQLFHENNWQKRAEAARQLGLLKDGRAINMLCRALKSEKDHVVINRIIEALGRIGDGKATMRIIFKLKEEQDKLELDKYRVIYILESLIRIKDKRALAYIVPLLNFPDDDIQELTRKAFNVIEPNWRQIIKRESDTSIEEIFKN